MRSICLAVACLVLGACGGDDEPVDSEANARMWRDIFQAEYETLLDELYPGGGATLCERAEVMIETLGANYNQYREGAGPSAQPRTFSEQCDEYLTEDEARCITRTPDPRDVECCYDSTPVAPTAEPWAPYMPPAHCLPQAP